jgi:hypothetical protein
MVYNQSIILLNIIKNYNKNNNIQHQQTTIAKTNMQNNQSKQTYLTNIQNK